jgi:hypothetical protein
MNYGDGPYIYTEHVVAQSEARGAKATFFVTGNNLGKGYIDESWAGVISEMYANEHQIASHTWSHQNLDQITHEQRVDHMVKNEMAIRNIIGKYPTYMRPPYSACYSAACQTDMAALGYVVTLLDLDTDDCNQLTDEKIQVANDNFKSGIDTAGAGGDRSAIAHDIHELTALNLTGYMLDYIYSNGWTAVTIGECMNEPVADWYRDSTPGTKPSATPSSSVPIPAPTGPTSLDGSCGGTLGQSCIGFAGPDDLSECCSPAGYYSNKDTYCSSGCNPLLGKCGPQPIIATSTTSTAPLPTVSLETTIIGECGSTTSKTCKGFALGGVKAKCCSQYGYCGNTVGYCGTGCNAIYGNCGSSDSSSSASSSASASASASASTSHSSSASSFTSMGASSSSSASHAVSSISHPASSHVASATPLSVHSSVAHSSAQSSSPSASTHHSSTAMSTPASHTPSATIFRHDSTLYEYSTTISTSDVHSTYTPSPASSTPVSKDTVYPTRSLSAYPHLQHHQALQLRLSLYVVYHRATQLYSLRERQVSYTHAIQAISQNGKCGEDNGGQACKFFTQ